MSDQCIKPVSYLQTNSKWSAHDYSAKGEKKTIGSSGCGPTSAAMIIQTLRPDLKVTPVTTAEWSKKHGYKFKGQGTAYAYFKPQFEEYGIDCRQLNTNNLYHNPDSKLHTEVKQLVNNGHFVIAVMGPGNWTRGGHYVVLWRIKDGYVYINDPASTLSTRTKGSWSRFKNEVKYYWVIDYGTKTEVEPCYIYKSDDVTKKLHHILDSFQAYLIRDLKNGWSTAIVDGDFCYIRNEYIEKSKKNFTGYLHYKVSKPCKMHKKNRKSSEVIISLLGGQEVQLITKRAYWSYVRVHNSVTNKYTYGWISTKVLKKLYKEV